MNRPLSAARRRPEIRGENCGEGKQRDKYSRNALGPRGTDRPYHQNTHTIFLDTHITSCQDFADARGDKSIFWDYFYAQRPLTLRASRPGRRLFAAVNGRAPDTLEQRNYTVSGAPAALLSLLFRGTRDSFLSNQSTKSPA